MSGRQLRLGHALTQHPRVSQRGTGSEDRTASDGAERQDQRVV